MPGRLGPARQIFPYPVPAGKSLGDGEVVVTIDVTGTFITGGVLESEIVTGGETLIFTLTGDTWLSDLGDDTAETTSFLAAILGDDAGSTGWDAEVALVHGNLARTSDTIMTLTTPAAASYVIIADETLSFDVPASAFTLRVLSKDLEDIGAITSELSDIADMPGLISHCDVTNVATVTLSGADIDEVADQAGVDDDKLDSALGGTPPVWGEDLFGASLDGAIFTNSGKEIIQHASPAGELDNFFDGGGWVAWAIEMKSTTGSFGIIFEHDSINMACRGTDTTGRPFELQVLHDDGDQGRWVTDADTLPNDAPAIMLIEYNATDNNADPVITINAAELTVGSGITETSTPTGTRRSSTTRFWGHDTTSACDVDIAEELIGTGVLSAGNKAFLLAYLRDKYLP